MSAPQTRPWKILAMGRGKTTAAKAEEHLHQMGYPNVKVFGVENNKESDDEVVRLLKSDNWDGVSIGNLLNLFIAQLMNRFSRWWIEWI